jgi:hypothetical protein
MLRTMSSADSSGWGSTGGGERHVDGEVEALGEAEDDHGDHGDQVHAERL